MWSCEVFFTLILLLFLFLCLFTSFNHLFSSRRRDSNEDSEYDRSSFSSKVSTILLRFRNKKWEMSFLREQDLMLKYSTFMCFIVFIGIIVAQTLNNPWAISKFTSLLNIIHFDKDCLFFCLFVGREKSYSKHWFRRFSYYLFLSFPFFLSIVCFLFFVFCSRLISCQTTCTVTVGAIGCWMQSVF